MIAAAPHTLSRPAHTAAMADVLSNLAARRIKDLPGGRVSAKRYGAHGPRGHFDRIAVYAEGRVSRAALLTVSGVGADVLGPIVAALIDYAPGDMVRTAVEALYEEGAAELHAESVHTVCRMRRDNRAPARRADGSAGWRVPGADIGVEPWALTVVTSTASVRVSLDGPRWTPYAAAAVLDAALWQLAPEARHMTLTTGDRSSVVSGDCSVARCSCGWSVTGDDRDVARMAARNHKTAETARARFLVQDTAAHRHMPPSPALLPHIAATAARKAQAAVMVLEPAAH